MNPSDYQAIVSAPGFALGINCDNNEIFGITFLEPVAERAPRGPLAREAARQLRAYMEGPLFVFDLPLAAAGTPFQRKVWQGIAAIRCGKTRSYGDVAQELHSGPRAVGGACRANPYPIVVPCHRVVAADGALGGFAGSRGGLLINIKRWLLDHEHVPASQPLARTRLALDRGAQMLA